MLRCLRKTPQEIVNWNEKGVFSIHGEIVNDSNIIDLINEAIRSRRTLNTIGRH